MGNSSGEKIQGRPESAGSADFMTVNDLPVEGPHSCEQPREGPSEQDPVHVAIDESGRHKAEFACAQRAFTK
jgi:hypothetical protein